MLMFGTKIQKNWNVWTQTSQDSFAKNEQRFIYCHGSVRPEHNINTDENPAENTQKKGIWIVGSRGVPHTSTFNSILLTHQRQAAQNNNTSDLPTQKIQISS